MEGTARRIIFGTDELTDRQIRKMILTVCYAEWHTDPFSLVSMDQLIQKIPADRVAIERNIQYLAEKYYIKSDLSTAGYDYSRITHEGIDIFEDFDAFSVEFSARVEQTVNVSGDYIAPIIHGTNNTINIRSEIENSFNNLNKELAKDNRYKPEIKKYITQLQDEISKETPDTNKIHQSLNKIGSFGSWVNEHLLKHPIIAQLIASYALKVFDKTNPN